MVETAKYLRPSGPKYKTYREGIGIGNGNILISSVFISTVFSWLTAPVLPACIGCKGVPNNNELAIELGVDRALILTCLAADTTEKIGSVTDFLQVIGNPSIITIVPNGVGIEINGL